MAHSPADGLPPGPRWPPLLQALATARLPLFLRYCHRRYGDRFTVRMGRFGTYLYLVDPADIRDVFRGDDEVFHAGEANAPILGRVLGGSSVLCTDEDVHLRQRRQMSGPFHGESVARLAPTMADIAADDVSRWPIGSPFSVLPHMRRVTLEVILRTVIGLSEADGDRLPRLRSALAAVAEIDLLTMLVFIFPGLRGHGRWARYAALVRRADALLRAEIERCRTVADLEDRHDVLAMLIRGTDMSTDELRDQLMTLLMAGHETTATGLSWTLERLVRHPQVLAAAQRAAREGDSAYLDAVVTESLRARPVVPDITRLLKANVTIGEDDRRLMVPAGTYVDPAIYLILRSAAHYPEPEVFRPERFVGRRPDPAVWLPFGGGSRRCLGAAFALTEMRVVLSTILERVDLVTTSERGERTRVRHVTLTPSGGARITVRRRRPEAPDQSAPATTASTATTSSTATAASTPSTASPAAAAPPAAAPPPPPAAAAPPAAARAR